MFMPIKFVFFFLCRSVRQTHPTQLNITNFKWYFKQLLNMHIESYINLCIHSRQHRIDVIKNMFMCTPHTEYEALYSYKFLIAQCQKAFGE